jgi:hypothetical protein
MKGILPGTTSVIQILRNGKWLGIAANKIWKGKNEDHVE